MARFYCYGMISPSTVHVLKEGFPYPRANTYAEIGRTLLSVGGEAANSAVILSKLGEHAVLDGTWVRKRHAPQVFGLLEPFGTDLSLVTVTDEGGTEEIVIADGISRTVFGNYASFHSGPRQWNEPSRQAIVESDIAALDPYFRESSENAARICVETGTPYVTLDSRHDDYIARHAAAIAISHELTDSAYPGADMEALFEEYLKVCNGLVVFTFGEKELWYGRTGGGKHIFKPFAIDPIDTTGAGDSFRGALAYGLAKGYSDEDTVRFASGVAALVCLTMPHALNGPGLSEVLKFLKERA
ncbi:MAG: carbohydrate kinase family protein [Spirochaetales bacterium]|nr:carbohydrate kinase family protein [Spirochaetales bacterium]